MQNIDNYWELCNFEEGPFGPIDSVPLLENLIAPALLDMIAIGYFHRNRKSVSGIIQNNGRVFPKRDYPEDIYQKDYCKAIHSTTKGAKRCGECDYWAAKDLLVETNACVSKSDDKSTSSKKKPQLIDSYGKVVCYKCHAGLVELIRPISLYLGNGTDNQMTVAAIWAGQYKLKEFSFSNDEIRSFADEIEYEFPDRLIEFYNKIDFTKKPTVHKRAEKLEEIAIPVEDMASISFQRTKQLQFEKLSTALLANFRKTINRIDTDSEQKFKTSVYLAMHSLMQTIESDVGRCFSAICELPSIIDNKNLRVKVVAHAGKAKRKLTPSFNIRLASSDEKQVTFIFNDLPDSQIISIKNSNDIFLHKFKNTINIDSANQAIITNIKSENIKLSWILFLYDDCNVLMADGKPLLDFVKMIHVISNSISEIIHMAYLTMQTRGYMKSLQESTKELEYKNNQNKILVRNIAHQVSRPILELKQSAYILSHMGFSEDTYRGFLACLMEMERGVRIFNICAKLELEMKNKSGSYFNSESLNLNELLEDARIRIKPYLDVQRRQLLFSKKINKGFTVPNVIGHKNSILECLVNVFHNAIKYSIGSRPIQVEISYEASVHSVYIMISNYGIELPEDDWDNIFNETFRSDSAKQVAIEGAGVGLYISRNLVNIHGGEVRVQSCEQDDPTNTGKSRWKTVFLISLKC